MEGEETNGQISNGSVKERRREQGRKCNQIKVVKVSSVAWLCLGLIIGWLQKFLANIEQTSLGCTFGAPWTEDLMDLIRGYRWNRLDRFTAIREMTLFIRDHNIQDILMHENHTKCISMTRCILETPEPHGYGVDFCRVPVDCEICSDVIISFHSNTERLNLK